MVKFTLWPDVVLTNYLGYVSENVVKELREKGNEALRSYCYNEKGEEAFWPDVGEIYSFLNLPAHSYWDYNEDFEYNLRLMFKRFYFNDCLIEKDGKEVSIYKTIFDSESFPDGAKILWVGTCPGLWTKDNAYYDSECEEIALKIC